MSIESEILLKGGNDIVSRLSEFMGTLIIKNRQEAELFETTESHKHYRIYRKAVGGNSTFFDHTYTKDDMISFGISKSFVDEYFSDPAELHSQMSKIPLLQNFIQKLRREVITGYTDKNTYYSDLMGKPSNPSDVIKIINRDDPRMVGLTVQNLDDLNSVEPIELSDVNRNSYPETNTWLYSNGGIDVVLPGVQEIPLHDITYAKYTKSYVSLYVEGIMDKIIEDNPSLNYLNYLVKGLDIIKMREAGNFSIMWSDNRLLDSTEIDYFYDAYGEVKDYILQHKYITTMEEMYEHYSNFQIMNIIYGTMQKMGLSYLDKFNIRDYTEADIFDILDSLQLGILKSVDSKLLRRIIDNIDELIAYRGTEEVLTKLLDIIAADNTISVKRYDLVKRFPIDQYGKTTIDPNIRYDDNVQLAFVNRTIYSSEDMIESKKSNGEVVLYEDFVSSDDTWGGIGVHSNPEAKAMVMDSVKHDILKIPFNRMDTKYIGITSTLNIKAQQDRFIQKYGLFIQWNNGLHAGLGDLVELGEMEFRAADLFNIAYYGSRVMDKMNDSSMTDLDLIDARCWTMSNMMRLHVGNVKDTVADVNNIMFKPPLRDYELRVGEVLDKYDLSDYVITFGSSNSDEVLDRYDQMSARYEKLKEMTTRSVGKLEVEAWKVVLKFFQTSLSIKDVYSGHTSFETMFKSQENDIFELIDEKFHSDDTYTNVENFTTEAINAFKLSIFPHIRESIASIDIESNVKNGSDISLLVDTFVSIYVELRDVDIDINLTDYPYNTVQVTDDYVINSTYEFAEYLRVGDRFSIHTNHHRKETVFVRESYMNVTEHVVTEKMELTDVLETITRNTSYESGTNNTRGVYGISAKNEFKDSTRIDDKFKDKK